MQNLIIIFTRFPSPGKTKTRLTPALGAKGAAELQRRMTENTLQQALLFKQKTPCEIEVSYHGADLQAMENWLGPLHFSPQIGHSLGERMQHAFNKKFTDEPQKIILVGTDCPALSSNILSMAFEALNDHNLVLGPSHDGGYFLIGLQRDCDYLFKNINWGTDSVLAQTVQKAKDNGLSVQILEYQHDIDHPEDLKYLRDNPGFK